MRFERERLKGIGAAHVADALIKLGLPKRFARPGTKPAFAIPHLVIGPALPVRHFGAIDVFLAAFERAPAGAILVIDNQGRLDEGCIGDLNAIEAQKAGLTAIVIDGAHRDTAQLREIGLPVFSLGSIPYGPTAMRPATPGAVMLGDTAVTEQDTIVADEDGVIMVETSRLEEVLAGAAEIARREETQRAAMDEGRSLREQLKFQDFLREREKNPALSFRDHVTRVRRATESQS